MMKLQIHWIKAKEFNINSLNVRSNLVAEVPGSSAPDEFAKPINRPNLKTLENNWREKIGRAA